MKGGGRILKENNSYTCNGNPHSVGIVLSVALMFARLYNNPTLSKDSCFLWPFGKVLPCISAFLPLEDQVSRSPDFSIFSTDFLTPFSYCK